MGIPLCQHSGRLTTDPLQKLTQSFKLGNQENFRVGSREDVVTVDEDGEEDGAVEELHGAEHLEEPLLEPVGVVLAAGAALQELTAIWGTGTRCHIQPATITSGHWQGCCSLVSRQPYVTLSPLDGAHVRSLCVARLSRADCGARTRPAVLPLGGGTASPR